MNEIIHKIKGYLGYKVQVIIPYFKSNLDSINLIAIFENEAEFKLMLRPLEDLTDEELDYIVKIEGFPSLNMRENTIKYINHYVMEEILTIGTTEYFLKNHIDYQGLIAQGLAIKKEQTNA
jgi:hypothetical protein